MEVYKKNKYEYVLFGLDLTRHELTGEWEPEEVARFIKELEKEE